MSSRLLVLDRLVCLLVGLVLAGGALALLDWRYGWLLDVYPDRLALAPATEWVDAGWWPWAVGGAGLVLAVVAVFWLLAHLRRTAVGHPKLPGSDQYGQLTVDLASVASAAATSLRENGPIDSVRTTTRTVRGTRLVELEGSLTRRADATALLEASGEVSAQIREAFPDESTRVRVIVNGPRPQRAREVRAAGTPRVS